MTDFKVCDRVKAKFSSRTVGTVEDVGVKTAIVVWDGDSREYYVELRELEHLWSKGQTVYSAEYGQGVVFSVQPAFRRGGYTPVLFGEAAFPTFVPSDELTAEPPEVVGAAELRVRSAPDQVWVEESEDETPRESVLSEASSLITGDRNKTYGSPTQNFTDTAKLWTVLLRPKLAEGQEIEPGEVASLMIALKLARMGAQSKRDNWVDVAGYAGCGFEADVDSGRIQEDKK